MSRCAAFLSTIGILLAIPCTALPGEAPLDARQVEFFEKKIRPMLARHCYECHSAKAEEPGGDLLLDTRDGSRRGGLSGPAVVPGDLDESLLISAIRHEGLEMPPDKRLPDAVIADFVTWIKMNAPDPRTGKSTSVKRKIDFQKAREFWSLRPINRPSPPKVANGEWARTDVDRFILARLESQGLSPVADADPQVLVRRVFFDLTGLPPSPEQVDQFVADPSPAALSRLIDELLDSPQFGERWGRHWLDVVRYGESTGMERNYTYPYAWRYRDYVIEAFNEDKPYDRFITEQVAGDLMEADDSDQRQEQLVATGLLALGPKSLNEPSRDKFVMDVVDEQIDVTTQAFIGLTVACARCHDHRFDPIPQNEYYSLAGIFCSTDTYYGTGGARGNRQSGRLLALGPDGIQPVAAGGAANSKTEATRLSRQATALRRRIQQLQKQGTPAALKNVAASETRLKKIEAQIARLNQQSAPPASPASNAAAIKFMGVQDAARPADTQLRVRGEATDRGPTVPRRFPTAIPCGTAPEIDPAGSGRLEYAQWLTSPENPLTARVAVNRIWMHLFGHGIVSTVNNFGATGDRPTHPELLDYLACEFRDNGWSVKETIRTLMNSRVYQLAADRSEQAEAIDPDNHLLWKMNQRRLEAEAIRDAMLAVSGQLDLTPAKGSVVQTIGDGDIGRSVRPERFDIENGKRSVYLPIARGVIPEVLRVFDFPDPSIIYGQREVTTVPTQALFMMNSPFVIEQSEHFAQRIVAEVPSNDPERIELAYRLALSRSPSPTELDKVMQFVAPGTISGQGETDSSSVPPAKRWARFCQTLFACAEFRYIE